MTRLLLTCLLLGTMAQAQKAASPGGAPGSAPQPSPSVSPSAKPQTLISANPDRPTQPVITVKGVCSPKKPLPGRQVPPCATVITRQQFEKLLDAVNTSDQKIPANMRRNLATAYVDLLALSQAAEKAGTENDPRFLAVMQLVRLRTLGDVYRRSLEEKYRNPPPDEILAYYNENRAKYEEVTLSRIFIPSKNPSAPNKDEWDKKAKQTADEMRERGAKGEDFGKLQPAAFTALGLTTTPPTSAVGARRRGMLAPQQEQEIFALKAGDVSKVEQEAAAYIVYKVESTQTLPMDRVKDEISRELLRQKMDKALREINSSVHAEFNDDYFGPLLSSPAGSIPNPAQSPAPK
jgi:hypothetical protein